MSLRQVRPQSMLYAREPWAHSDQGKVSSSRARMPECWQNVVSCNRKTPESTMQTPGWVSMAVYSNHHILFLWFWKSYQAISFIYHTVNKKPHKLHKAHLWTLLCCFCSKFCSVLSVVKDVVWNGGPLKPPGVWQIKGEAQVSSPVNHRIGRMMWKYTQLHNLPELAKIYLFLMQILNCMNLAQIKHNPDYFYRYKTFEGLST